MHKNGTGANETETVTGYQRFPGAEEETPEGCPPAVRYSCVQKAAVCILNGMFLRFLGNMRDTFSFLYPESSSSAVSVCMDKTCGHDFGHADRRGGGRTLKWVFCPGRLLSGAQAEHQGCAPAAGRNGGIQ